MFAIGEQTVSSNIASILNATTPLFTLLIGVAIDWRGDAGNRTLGADVAGGAGRAGWRCLNCPGRRKWGGKRRRWAWPRF